MGYKEEFCEIFRSQIARPGSEKLLTWMEGTDFFTAPASTRFHGACAEGLVMHSLNVYHALMEQLEEGDSPESFAICALLHDLCKVNFYAVDYRNAKNAQGIWEKVPYYTIRDTLPYGHGEKSVYIISGFMRLSREEAFAIRFHMGFSGNEDKGLVGQALEQFPLALALSVADMEASYYLEGSNQ